jgi:hypothetical protein
MITAKSIELNTERPGNPLSIEAAAAIDVVSSKPGAMLLQNPRVLASDEIARGAISVEAGRSVFASISELLLAGNGWCFHPV